MTLTFLLISLFAFIFFFNAKLKFKNHTGTTVYYKRALLTTIFTGKSFCGIIESNYDYPLFI